MSSKTVAVIGGGWSGLAAAVEAARHGCHVNLYEMAPQLGGRAKQIHTKGLTLDNGHHILIGAYSKTLKLMQEIGVDISSTFIRTPFSMVYPDGKGIQLQAGNPLITFLKAIVSHSRWNSGEKWNFLCTNLSWAIKGFNCKQKLTVFDLIKSLPNSIRSEFLEPLCLAAMNTPCEIASGKIFLRVLHDTLFSDSGAADLLLPRQSLSLIWPEPAARWLRQAGASIKLSHRIQTITRQNQKWQLDGEIADAVIVACSAIEAARLLEEHAPAWAKKTREISYESIATIYSHSEGATLPKPMMALYSNRINSPAQFVFDLGASCGIKGMFAFVVSGANHWLEKSNETLSSTVIKQGQHALSKYLKHPLELIKCIFEKRATFLCTSTLIRPHRKIFDNLMAAGDYIDGYYPATLEGAIRSGILAGEDIAKLLLSQT